MNDSVGAFLAGSKASMPSNRDGPLSNCRFGAKDVFDIEGWTTGCGNPDWARTHGPADRTAVVVQRLLDAGATLEGKTICDELAFSLNGQNIHHGTPRNSRAPGRLPGGSSSGSAAAVAAELVDFAIGTDTAGSIRVPASYCGLLGMRPTHGAVDSTGVVPLAARFDTVGWFARSANLLRRVGEVLLPRQSTAVDDALPTMLVAEDVFSLAVPPARAALMTRLETITATLDARLKQLTLSDAWLVDWQQCFSTLQGRQIWQTHGAWFADVQPAMAPDIAARFKWTSTIGEEEATAAEQQAERLVAPLLETLADGAVLWLPTAPGAAPLIDTPAGELQQHRSALLRQTAIASLAGLPQITLPVADVEGCPVGLSVIGGRGRDQQLLALVERILGE